MLRGCTLRSCFAFLTRVFEVSTLSSSLLVELASTVCQMLITGHVMSVFCRLETYNWLLGALFGSLSMPSKYHVLPNIRTGLQQA